jgi:hypothetical protein
VTFTAGHIHSIVQSQPAAPRGKSKSRY